MIPRLEPTRKPLEARRAGLPVAVPDLREGRGRKSDLGERRQPLGDVALEPAQRSAVEARGVVLGEEQAEPQRVVEAEPAELARGHLGAAKVAVRDGSGEATVWGPLRRHG